MAEPLRALFISQEIYPFLSEENPIRVINRKLPEVCQASGMETRTFMPKFGEINERRNQLHEVIRLSGMNIIIDDTDHPLLLKVASIQSARIQIYFIDNDDFFSKRKGLLDSHGNEYTDNDERSIFYVRGTLETVKKLFSDAKIVVSLDAQSFKTPFGTRFAEKLKIEGIEDGDLTEILNKQVTYTDLMKLAIHYADAVTIADPATDATLLDYANQSGKPVLPYEGNNPESYLNFFKGLL